jgi:hypothetical protein
MSAFPVIESDQQRNHRSAVCVQTRATNETQKQTGKLCAARRASQHSLHLASVATNCVRISPTAFQTAATLAGVAIAGCAAFRAEDPKQSSALTLPPPTARSRRDPPEAATAIEQSSLASTAPQAAMNETRRPSPPKTGNRTPRRAATVRERFRCRS